MFLRILFSLLAIIYILAINYLPFFVLDSTDGQETRRLFRDGGLIEDVQVLQLILAALLVTVAVVRNRLTSSARLEVFICIGLWWAAVRELDSFFESSHLVGVYYSVKYGLTALGAYWVFRFFRPVWAEWLAKARTPSLLLFQGGVSLYILAQIVASHLAGGDRILKRIWEESLELAGGSLIFLSASLTCLVALPALAKIWNGSPSVERDEAAMEVSD